MGSLHQSGALSLPVAVLMGNKGDKHMSAPRRGFLTFVGSALVSGPIVRAANGTTPTLILPPGAVDLRPHPPLWAEETQMHAVLRVKAYLPASLFQDWLEGGLRQARPYEEGPSSAEAEQRATAAAKHGSIIAAIQAGAL